MVGAEIDLKGVHVAVLGWAGASERQLRGVVRWYRERGAEVITSRARMRRAMSRSDGWELEGRDLAPRLLGADRIVLHLFSNVGFWTYAALLEERPGLPIEAVIVDSAPGFPPRISAAFYARHSTMAVMPLVLHRLGRPPALAHPLLTPPLWAVMRIGYHLRGAHVRFFERSLDVVARARRPHLVIYSPADSLVGAEHVEAFLERLDDPAVLRFERSEHVRHMVAHRGAYFAGVAGFLASHLPPSADRSAG